MMTAIIVIVVVFCIIIGGMMTLLRTANKYKFPDTYDKSKTGFDDEEEEYQRQKVKPKKLDE